MGWFAASLLLPWWAAYALVGLGERAARRDRAATCLRAGLALGIGVGLSSCGYFLWLLLVGPPGRLYHTCDLTVFAAVGLLVSIFRRTAAAKASHTDCVEISAAEGRWQRLLLATFVAAVALAVLGAIGVYWKDPLGDWDAWAIWNQRARYVLRAGDHWRQAFGPMFEHVDYPLLLPSGNARLWSYLGAEADWAPWLLGTLFTFATVGVLAAGLWRLRGPSQGLLAGLVLLGMVPFLQRGAWQYADVPLSFYLLAAVVLSVLHDAAARPPAGLLVLSGLMAGMAAWTKNEGLPLLVILPAARVAILWRRGCLRQAPRELFGWLLGAAPLVAMVALQKLSLAGSNYMVSDRSWAGVLRQLADASRYWQIVQALVLYAARIARPLAVVLPLAAWFLGRAPQAAPGRRGLPGAALVLALQLAGYFLVYVLTPCDLQWHLATSADRLLLQLCPLCLLVVFLWLATPEEALAQEAADREAGGTRGQKPYVVPFPTARDRYRRRSA